MKALEERQAEAEQKKAKEAKHRAEYDKKVAEREKRRDALFCHKKFYGIYAAAPAP